MAPGAIHSLFAVDEDEGRLLQETVGQLHGREQISEDMQFERELCQESLQRCSRTKKNNRDRDSRDPEAITRKKKSRYSYQSNSPICGNLSQGDEEDKTSLEKFLALEEEAKENRLLDNKEYEDQLAIATENHLDEIDHDIVNGYDTVEENENRVTEKNDKYDGIV